MHGAIVKAVKTGRPGGRGPAGDPARRESGLLLRRPCHIVDRRTSPEHWPEVARIYAEGIATGDATFETRCRRGRSGTARTSPRTASSRSTRRQVVGWVAVSRVSDRCVYGGVVENSVYVAARARGRGVGQLLLERSSPRPRPPGSGRSRPDLPRERGQRPVHERVGFEVVGRRKSLGKLEGVWRDVLLVERRSDIVE